MANDNKVINIAGYIIIFSFVSVIFIFLTMILIGGFNNFLLGNLYNFLQAVIGTGIIENGMADGLTAVEGIDGFIPYLDYFWLGSFISLFIGSLVYSYSLDRKNLFETFSFAVLGIIVFAYIGSYIIQLTDWFKDEILIPVFPNIMSQLPYFSWYLDNIGVVNLVIIVLCVIANFINLDIERFKLKKGGDNFEQI